MQVSAESTNLFIIVNEKIFVIRKQYKNLVIEDPVNVGNIVLLTARVIKE